MVALGSIDLDAYIEKNVVSPSQYLVNQGAQDEAQEIDKLPDVEKVDCCTINLTP